MSGETNLRILINSMSPALRDEPYIFCSLSQECFAQLSFEPLCTFREQEGMTVIAAQQQAADHGLTFDSLWACITLTVHSSLEAVGFLAAITSRLAQAGISVNTISAYYHDHLFVPWDSRMEVIAILDGMTESE
ncbi:MAG: ACT domain-containing protein [Anaerolineales bacterium]|nr:ACT domain-containing protein [Anaerolineales bacterium]